MVPQNIKPLALIKTMPIFKTPDLCNDIAFYIIDNLNKELVNGIAVDFDVFGYVVVQKNTFLPNSCLFFFKVKRVKLT